jgi:type I restriction enzyme, S subunit
MTEPFELPEGWCWANLEDIGSIAGGLTLNSSVRSSATEWVPLVTVAAVRLRAIEAVGIKRVGIIPADGNKGTLLPDDLLIVEGNGSVDQIGRAALWDNSAKNARHQNHLIRFRPVEVLPHYVLEWLSSPNGRSLLVESANTTTGLYNLSLSKLGRVKIPIAPMNEQGRITAKIEALQRRKSRREID